MENEPVEMMPGPLLSMLETMMELLTAAWPRPSCCGHLGRKQVDRRPLHCSTFQTINTQTFKTKEGKHNYWKGEESGGNAMVQGVKLPSAAMMSQQYNFGWSRARSLMF